MSRYLYSFGPFQLDTEQKVLLRDGQHLSLKPKVFDLLVVLVENSGRVVSKDDLLKQVWAGSFVEEGNLAVSIVKLRQALGETRNEHPYIETVSRRGYRFVASVTVGSGQRTDILVVPSSVAKSAEGESASNGTIAVLPFKVIGETGDEFLGLGMADALITRLSNLRHVPVRPTSSVCKYEGVHDPVSAGKELGVEWVLDGTVRKSSERIRVTVQVVSVSDGVVLWAEKFDEEFTDIFSVEDSISEQVAKALVPKLTRREERLLAKRYTYSAKAYELYLKGRYFLEKRTTDGCKTGIHYFERAIAIDPKYALAYAGLGGCYLVLGSSTALSSQESYLSAEKAILRALSLDNQLAEAHGTLGHLRIRRLQWSGAETELRRAIELNPNYAFGRMGLAIFLSLMGQSEQAFEQIKRAQTLDPVSPIIEFHAGSLLYFARRYDEALEQFRSTLEMDPGYALAHGGLGIVYETKGNLREAMIEYRHAMSALGNVPELVACLGRVNALAGRTRDALASISELELLSTQRPVQPTLFANIFEALGDKDKAFSWLEKAFAERDDTLCMLKVDPRHDNLRADPRFMSLLQRVGLSDANGS